MAGTQGAWPDLEKVALIVCDSFGVGEAPDADAYGDAGSNTLGHVAQAVGGLEAPNLGRLGLGLVTDVQGVPAEAAADHLVDGGVRGVGAPGQDEVESGAGDAPR